MSNLLKSLLKYSLLPASLMVIGKILGLVIATYYYELPVSTYFGSGFFSFEILIDGGENTVLANTVADSFMLGLMTILSTLLFIKYYIFIKSENNPRTILKLAKFNVIKWISNKDTVFIKVFAWALFLIATCALTIVNSLKDETSAFLSVVSFIVGILTLWFLLRIFEFELSRVYPNNTNKN